MRKFSRKILQTRKKLDSKHGFSLLQTSLCLPAKISLCLITGPRERCSWSRDDQSVAANVGKADMCTRCKSYLRSICNDCAKITSSSLDNLHRSIRCNCKFTKLINFTNEQSWTRTDQEILEMEGFQRLVSYLLTTCFLHSFAKAVQLHQRQLHQATISTTKSWVLKGFYHIEDLRNVPGGKNVFPAFKDPNIYKMHQIIKALRPWAE